MPPITPARRRELRAKAHHLHPVVRVGQHGLTPAVIREIDVNLRAHELIKVRVFSEARDERRALLERICAALDAAPVQQIGKLLVLWRPAPESAPEREPAESTRNVSGAKRTRAGKSTLDRNKGKAMAKSTPQVSSSEDSRASDCVQIAGQSRSAPTPTVSEYGVFSMPHTLAYLLLYNRNVA